MKLLVSIDGGGALELQLERSGDDRFRFHFEGCEWTASLVEVEPGVFSVLIGGSSYAARLCGPAVEIGGRTFNVDVRDPRRMGRQSRTGMGEGRRSVSSPMPGKVVRILVSKGDAVEAGQGLIVVEAMKMQNELKTPKSGKVVEIHTREGATVGAGEVLVAVE